MDNSIKAGWATVSITPHGRKVSLAGQYYERITDQVDCELMASVLTLHSQDESLTWVTCDIVGITDKLLEAVRASVSLKAPEINTRNIFMNAIHTHNAPFIKYSNILGRPGYFKEKSGLMGDKEYHDFAVERIVDAVISANENIQPGFTIESGTVNIRTGCCRRGILQSGEGVMYIDTSRPDFLKMEGPDGGPTGVLYLKNDKGALKGVIACLPCTAQILEHEFVISSDYTGRVRQMFWDSYGDDFVFIPLISAAGDLSPRNLVTKDYALGDMYKASGADRFAEKIFNGLVSEANSCNVEQLDTSVFNVVGKKVVLPGWVPTKDEYNWAKEVIETDAVKFELDDYVQKGVEPYYNQPLALAKKAESIIMKFEEKDKYRELDIYITAVRIGNISWVTNPFELFIEYGNRITAGANAESVWPVQLVNGYEGYFPTSNAVEAGGYSAYIQSVRVEPVKAGEILVNESISLINSLF